MDITYRCIICGNNILAKSDKDLECKPCGATSGFLEVTKENENSIICVNPYGYADIDPNIDYNFCNDKEGICPCGVFIAHLIDKKCNVIDTAVPKEPRYAGCYCKSSVSVCGHSISHRLIDPCPA